MKILVATKLTQGKRKNDFNWCNEGELVGPSVVECDLEKIDGPCGCKRAFCGLTSHKATTTARVVDAKLLTREKLAAAVRKSLVDGGWLKVDDQRDDAIGLIEDQVKYILTVAGHFEHGAVIERRGTYRRRKVA